MGARWKSDQWHRRFQISAQSVGYLNICNKHFAFWSLLYPAKFGEGLTDEDEWDEEWKDLLGKARDKADQEASLEGHCEHHDNDEPKPDPHTTR